MRTIHRTSLLCLFLAAALSALAAYASGGAAGRSAGCTGNCRFASVATTTNVVAGSSVGAGTTVTAGTSITAGTTVTAGTKFISSAASGANGLQLSTNGARADLGGGASDYLDSDGTRIRTGGELNVQGLLYSLDYQRSGSATLLMKGTPADGAAAVGFRLDTYFALTTVGAKIGCWANAGTDKACIDRNGGITPGQATLDTCSSANEGLVIRAASTGGTGTSARTRLCICTSDGAASPAYAWQNIATGTVGNTTDCNL